MAHNVLVTVFCPDRTGLVAEITAALFDLGANLGDTNFAMLGSGAEFTSVCELPDVVTAKQVINDLRAIRDLSTAQISVIPFTFETVHGPTGKITHRFTVRGGDSPGLIARLCEVFVEYKANIVRLAAEKQADGDYTIRFSVWIPEENTDSCAATVRNTAEGLQLACDVETIAPN